MQLQIINPHDQSLLAELPTTTPTEVQTMVKASKKAYQNWQFTTVEERAKYIQKFRDLLEKNSEKMAKIISQEMGKPLQQSQDEIQSELEFVDYYIAQSPTAFKPEVVLEKNGATFTVFHEPYGVCLCIAPWNFPLSMANSGVLPALLAGNTVILKPSEYTTLSQKMVIDLLNEAGLPEGVVQVAVGAGDVGAELMKQDINLLWFTGSTRTGRMLIEQASKKFVKSLLEMGGSSPAIVFADADMDAAVENVYWSRFLNCGQVCTAVKRLLVEASVYDAFVEKMKQRLTDLKLGNPLENSDIGPLVTLKQREILEAQVADAVEKGATVVIGGKRPEDAALANGAYFEPTLLIKVTADMQVLTDEVFGPVLPILPFSTEEEAIKMANDTEYGLSAEVYTTDATKAQRVARQIQAGVVAVNTSDFFKPECPFGGYKLSGMGREYGLVGLREFAQLKTVTLA